MENNNSRKRKKKQRDRDAKYLDSLILQQQQLAQQQRIEQVNNALQQQHGIGGNNFIDIAFRQAQQQTFLPPSIINPLVPTTAQIQRDNNTIANQIHPSNNSANQIHPSNNSMVATHYNPYRSPSNNSMLATHYNPFRSPSRQQIQQISPIQPTAFCQPYTDKLETPPPQTQNNEPNILNDFVLRTIATDNTHSGKKIENLRQVLNEDEDEEEDKESSEEELEGSKTLQTTQELQLTNKDGTVLSSTKIITQNKNNSPIIVTERSCYEDIVRLSHCLKHDIEQKRFWATRCLYLNQCITNRYHINKNKRKREHNYTPI